ncbi:hypothetical protein LX64_02008 [Chitinophaga skermanii]|uniref:Uncharacterized protein n=1 Tax=Chitinophaga skermanii TaxID=331697 RepID=A0A327QRC5_9BACT|nr:hypothetical protein LX64_02008 [Chitinophaga skermanii]
MISKNGIPKTRHISKSGDSILNAEKMAVLSVKAKLQPYSVYYSFLSIIDFDDKIL